MRESSRTPLPHRLDAVLAEAAIREDGNRTEDRLARLRVNAFSISLDGYGAGPDQSRDDPLGKGGERLHEWFIPTHTFQSMQGQEAGTTGVDDDFGARSMENLGAWILGRNMFGPVRGPWPDEEWKGWWGESPPYHVPVFVLTHYARPPLEMKGGTVFHFVTGGIHEALDRARAAAGDRDVRVGGGAATIRQYLAEGLIDDLHLAIAPVLLGRGESLFEGLDLPALGYEVTEHVPAEKATHVVFSKSR
jgi:dihydrofolate reductase